MLILRRLGGGSTKPQKLRLHLEEPWSLKTVGEVPVVFIDGRKAFKHRMDRHQLLRVLAGRKDSVLPRRMSD